MSVYSKRIAMPQTPKYDIFLDGSCSFCRWSRTQIELYDSDGKVQFLDYNDSAVAAQAPFPRAELDQEMHMRTPEGKWLLGFEAWLALLRVLPKLAWLGRIASVPPLRWLGPPVYGFIARHRYNLPGAPTRCDTDTCAPPSPRPQ
jgi:predicted DCC family thiol-disulfide oxidoreductase YuxK